MEVMPEFSRLTGFTPGDNQPIIDVRSTSTVLSVTNRQVVVIGGLRQRSDIGDFKGIPYLKDVKLVGRLFRSRDTDVRESELVVFIMPEIIDCADAPSCRQQMVADTVRCRLDQIPEAEGCPPCCRRLPPGAMDGLTPSEILPVGGPTRVEAETLPAAAATPVLQQPESVLPLTAGQIHSAEFQFGPAGRAEHVRVLVATGRLRRLPSVETGDAVVAESHGSSDQIIRR
jgi:hypothetical protein